ncbi:MAG: AlpA family phage regulatory protein [Pseudomonadota bacterium]
MQVKLIRRPKVEELTSLSASAIYKKIELGTFPRPVRIRRQAVAWRESDILTWIDDLKTTDIA